MCSALRAKPSANMWFDSSDREVTLTGDIEGIPFKGRADLLNKYGLTDLKTTERGVDGRSVGSQFANLRYDIQLGIYRHLLRQNGNDPRAVHVIAVEKPSRNSVVRWDYLDVCVFPVPEAALDNGMEMAIQLVRKMKKCQARGEWPGADGGEDYGELIFPQWFFGADDERIDWSEAAA